MTGDEVDYQGIAHAVLRSYVQEAQRARRDLEAEAARWRADPGFTFWCLVADADAAAVAREIVQVARGRRARGLTRRDDSDT